MGAITVVGDDETCAPEGAMLVMREGWEVYEISRHEMSGHVMVETISFPTEAQPSINFKHVDGPVLCCRDGSIHWLTYWERFMLWLGKINVHDLDKKYGYYHRQRKIV